MKSVLNFFFDLSERSLRGPLAFTLSVLLFIDVERFESAAEGPGGTVPARAGRPQPRANREVGLFLSGLESCGQLCFIV